MCVNHNFIKPDQIDMDLSNFEDVELNNLDSNKKNMLLLDDVDFIKSMYKHDFKIIKDNYNIDIEKSYNLIYIVTKDCGYRAKKMLDTKDIKIDIAFLDLSLGYIHLDKKGNIVELDGIDVAYLIKKYNPNCKVYFYTAHYFDITTYNNILIKEYKEKFHTFFNKDIEEFIINKDKSRLEHLYNAVIKVNNEE